MSEPNAPQELSVRKLEAFQHETLGQRVLFGSGTAQEHLYQEVSRIGGARVMAIASRRDHGLAVRLTETFPSVHHHNEVVPHVPVDVVDQATLAATQTNTDVIVSIGGGSATGLAKAVALSSGLPIVAVPTTYAGSEATNIWGITSGSRKTTGNDPRVLPVSIVYDAQLTLSLPVGLSVASGMNALAHCIDAFWAPRANPINAALAAEGIRTLAAGLAEIVVAPNSIEAREFALLGTYLAGVALTSAGSGLHHKICHVLGGAFGLPHAATHSAILPHVAAFNLPASDGAAERIALALGGHDAIEALVRLRNTLYAPRALSEYGLLEEQIPQAVSLALEAVPTSNPRVVSRADMTQIIMGAWAGKDPL